MLITGGASGEGLGQGQAPLRDIEICDWEKARHDMWLDFREVVTA